MLHSGIACGFDVQLDGNGFVGGAVGDLLEGVDDLIE